MSAYLTPEQALALMLKGAIVKYEVADGHVMHAWHEDGMIFVEAQQPAWSAGVVEPACMVERAPAYFAERVFELVRR